MQATADFVILVVGYRNADDVKNCVRALGRASETPDFEVFITENGGPEAMDSLVDALLDGGLCWTAPDSGVPLDRGLVARQRRLAWCRPDGSVRMWINVAEATENLGYGGGVNAWLRPLLAVPGWQGAWILNPDTEPAPTALAELVAYARRRGKGMVGNCMLPYPGSERIHSRGLAWHKLAARTAAVDLHAACDRPFDLDSAEARLDAPSGASLFATRALIETIGLMDERYFLYFEDLEWGLRAKPHGGIGYAHAAVVPHKGATTTRTTEDGHAPSVLTVYLEFRNRILFVRRHYPFWLPWTLAMQVMHALLIAKTGSFDCALVAGRGILAGILGETGRPDRMMTVRRPDLAGRANDPALPNSKTVAR